MKIMVTGAAGFIGSHLVSELVQLGHLVTGVDSFTPYYSLEHKKRNLAFSQLSSSWEFLEQSVGSLLANDLKGFDTVIHLAAQPGVRASWGDFAAYLHLNLDETNTLAAAIAQAGVPRVVFASSSSVYGDASSYPTSEADKMTPRSPYGVTKLAGESLWEAHTLATEVEVAAMRFFTVYGPGQRPDMATQRLIRAAYTGELFTLFGSGEQRRDFTYVTDVVQACISAAAAPFPKRMNRFNIGGTGDTSMNALIDMIESATGREIALKREDAQRGDVLRTGADCSLAHQQLGWSPKVSIQEGIAFHARFEQSPSLETWSARP